MLAEFGFGILVLSLLVALYSAGAAFLGARRGIPALVESGRRALLLTWPLISLAALCLIILLVTNRFEVSFVYEVTSRSMPSYLKVTAWWGGQAGSLIFWSWLMSAFASLVTLRKWDRDREFLPWVIVICSITMAFFLTLSVFFENPFARYWQTLNGELLVSMFAPANAVLFTPLDGRGLNPLLRHPGMIIHPPMLYLGFVSFVIPYAFAMAALITGRTDDRWIRITRRWTLWAWLFLSCGLVLGSRWAYDVLGWGGFWGWDPVEVAALMPWLAGTAFLHSVMIQEKRGMLKHWSMFLIILTYVQVIYGTFLTRSGILSSVHAFAQSAIGPAFFIFIGVSLFGSFALLIYRWESLKTEAELTSLLSREALFVLNNFIFLCIDVVCFIGVHLPLISEIFTGEKVTVGPPWYERINGPLFAVLLLLMGIAPLSAWGHSTWQTLGRALWKPAALAAAVTALLALKYTHNLIALTGFGLVALVLAVTLYEFWRASHARQNAQKENFFTALYRLVGRNRRRYGGYIIHISMVLMAIGILGIELFQQQTQGTLAVDDAVDIGGYTVQYDQIASFTARDQRQVRRAVVSIYKHGKYLGELYPRIDYFPDAQQTMTIPAQHATLSEDLYILLLEWQPASASGATFKIYVNPLVNWLWIGSFVFLFGILIAAWPDREPDYETARAAQPAQPQASAAD
ncbi:MAG TPA: heme lyase CcmF/NrfE family subunit [Anaerolineales bacterium]|jgi:cytochrome c-type biogenesis protein CcmF